MLPLDCGQEFDAAHDADFFAAIPARPGILLIEMRTGSANPHLVKTTDLHRAAERLLRLPDPVSKRLNLREVAARVRYRLTGSKFEQSLTLYYNAAKYFPGRYRDLLRLRPPALLKVNLRNEYPRCYVTRQIRADEAFYFGPFASRRAATAFSEGFLDLFKIRRCQIKIRRDPAFPGCIYSEMKMCLAPCFAGCTKEEYDAEVTRVLETLDTTGAALTSKFESEREAASEALDFERAAALHKRLEKVSAALRGLPDLARRIDDLDAIILQRAAEPQTVAVFPLRAGILSEPIFLRFGELSSQPQSAEVILRDALELQTPLDSHSPSPLPASAPQDVAVSSRAQYGLHVARPELRDHLSLVARWFYSKPREGEILFREHEDAWPYRRILRACSRILAPPQPAPPSSPGPQPKP